MNTLFLVFIFLLGAAVGSFLNAVIYRWQKKEQFISGRSRCPHCGRTIRWYDLFPVVSWLALVGRCRACRHRLSVQYLLVEAAVGGLWLAGALWLPADLSLLTFWVAVAFSTVLFVIDAQHYTVPDQISIPAAVVIFLLNWARGVSPWSLIIAVLIGGGWFGAQFLVSRGKWVGGGDIRLGMLMGALLGYPLIILGLMMAYIGGSLIAVVLMVLGRKHLGSRLPFATMLLPASLAVFLWGEGIWGWYLKLLGF